MGREIREVPAGWKHPKSDMNYFGHPKGEQHYTPLFKDCYGADNAEWHSELAEWLAGFHEAQIAAVVEDHKYGTKETYARTEEAFTNWHGDEPNSDWYVKYDTYATHVQMYETVSEGTPVSPVFETREDLADWLVESEGYDRQTADSFCRRGWVPSGVISDNSVSFNLDAIAVLEQLKKDKLTEDLKVLWRERAALKRAIGSMSPFDKLQGYVDLLEGFESDLFEDIKDIYAEIEGLET